MPSKKPIFLILATLLLIASVATAFASPLNLTVVSDKQVYNVGETVYVSGNLTLYGSLVSDAIVATEIDDPRGGLFVVRTLSTGLIDPNQWPIKITELFPCSANGIPQYSFNPGGNVYFRVTANNSASNPYSLIIILSIVYSNGAPFSAFLVFNGSIEALQPLTITSYPVSIPPGAVTGNTTVYANIYTALPRDNGFAHCPEKSASFMIGTGGSGHSPPSSNGQFTFEIALAQILVRLGNYTIYATTHYSYFLAFSTSTFKIILVGDLYPDGVINMRDIAIVARLFGTHSTDPGWNPAADLYPDGLINMRDVAIVGRAFGTRAIA